MLKVTEEEFLAARQRLTEYVLAEGHRIATSMGFGWAAVEDAPQDYDSLKTAYWRSVRDRVPLPVWSGASGETMYTTPEANHAFRFWHDVLHVRYGLDFSVAGELSVAKHHIAEVAAMFGEASLEAKLMALDTAGQVLYRMVEGQHVVNQLAYVRCVLDLE